MNAKTITAVKMPHETYYGKRYSTETVADIARGTNVDMVLLSTGNLHIRLTGKGRELLRELQQDPRIVEASYAEYRMLQELIGDEFLCNGWGFAWNAGEWGHMSDAPILSDSYTYGDEDEDADGERDNSGDRLWFDNESAIQSLITRLEFGNLIFTWWGKHVPDVPVMPTTMRLY